MANKRVSSERIANILNRISLGGSINKISNEIGERCKLIWEVERDFPLWSYYRKKDREKESDSSL